MLLTQANYFSKEAERDFMSRSQYKEYLECEAKQEAKLRGEWDDGTNIAFEVGSYVHSWLSLIHI